MKEKLKKSSILDQWFFTQSPLIITRPALRETAACLGHLAAGFLLSCGSLSGQPAPFALGLITASGGGLRGLCALLGAVAGFLTMQPFSQGLELTSAAILTFVTMYIFGSLWVTKRPWFRCLVPGLMRGAVGSIFLFSRELSPLLLWSFAESLLLSALSPLAFDALLQGKKRAIGSLLSLCFFVIGGASILLPWGIRLGAVFAVALSAVGTRRADFGTAAVLGAGTGLALDAALMTGGTWTLCLSAAALTGGSVSRRHPLLRLLTFAAGFSAAVLYEGSLEPYFFLTLAFGGALSLLLPPGVIVGREESAIAQSAALVEERLGFGQTALKELYDAIGLDPAEQLQQEQQHIFDKAAGKVCRRCPRYSCCWDKQSQETYQILRGTLGTILDRGQALREDFPEEFSQECRHMEGFLVALNQELDGIAYRSQCRSRTEENRLIVSRSLLHMSELLGENARQLRAVQRIPQEAYTVKVGVSAKGRHGVSVSGDRGLCLHTEDGRLFAILCDGSGTGPEAARESLLAVDTLAALLQAGMVPDKAMEFLNSMYILRDSGGFSTMDVLELSLLSGQGTLYKWGAAPSYIRSGTLVKKVGTAAPPPGLGVGSTSGPEVIRLSLWGGDMLVLVSDGVLGDETEELIRSYDGENVKELAAMLISQAEAMGGEDDMTAAVLRLEEKRT
jgi:stage II sporulation protein E